MGFGDSLITTSIVKRAKQKHPDRPVVVGDGTQIKWCEVFDNNPKIAKEITPDCVWVRAAEGHNRPYIDYQKSTKERAVWKPYKVEPGELYLTSEETDWPDRGFVYIEPNIKGVNNKDWGFDNWQKVVDALPDVRFVQGPGRRLDGVTQRSTDSFRHACGLLFHADLFVGTDGGLHHAAAALGKRAVVVWGGLIGPDILGYPTHKNLWSGAKACGNYGPCQHCKDALAKITVGMVIEAIETSVAGLETGSGTTL